MYDALPCVGIMYYPGCVIPFHGAWECIKLMFLISTGGVIPCLEHISLRKDTEKRNTALEREWLPLTVERFSREDALKAEQDSLINHYSYE